MRGLGADQTYWEHLAQGELYLPQCDSCGRWHWPAVYRCGDCGGWQHTWSAQTLRGTIFTWCRTWHDFSASTDFELPFISALVELDNMAGIRLLGTLSPDTEAVKIGDSVHGLVKSVAVGGREVPAIVWSLQQRGGAA